MSSVRIHYLDAHLLVAEKPPGLLCVPGRGADKSDCLLSRLQIDIPDALVVHRLDQATSGLTLFARSKAVQSALSKDFAAQQIHKRYVAVVRRPAEVSGAALSADWQRVEAPLLADWPNRPKQKIDPSGKPATTLWRCFGEHSPQGSLLLELEPLSGRTHQLRVHLVSRGMRILGDTLYANPGDACEDARAWCARGEHPGDHAVGEQTPTSVHTQTRGTHHFAPIARMMLHAYQLRFMHPVTGEHILTESAPEFLDETGLRKLRT